MLARWGGPFASPALDVGHVEPIEQSSGTPQMPWFSYSEEVLRLEQEMYATDWVYSFDWPAWIETARGRALVNDPEAIATATADELRQTLTALLRGERTNDGLLASRFEFGLMMAITKRAGELVDAFTGGSLPFDRYPNGGRTRLGRPAWGDGTARTGYGKPVFDACGYSCVYCGLDMRASFENWLQLSVDHVVPAQMGRSGVYDSDLVEDLTNLVTCCRACNDFGNRYTVSEPRPESDEAFYALRDRVFVTRKAAVHAKRAQQRAVFESMPAAGPDLPEPEGEARTAS